MRLNHVRGWLLVVSSAAVLGGGCGSEPGAGGQDGGGGGAAAGAAGQGSAPAGGASGAGGAAGAGGAPAGRADAGRSADAARAADARPDAGGNRDAGAAAGGTDGGSGARVVLFDGNGLGAWVSGGGGSPRWRVVDDAFEVVAGTGDMRTRQRFGDMRLHLEFQVPRTPETNGEQDRGNSGVYLQGRYEVQILDSFSHPLSGANDCASIYGVKDADSNQATPPETWQTFDILFRAARFNGTMKVQNARISVVWNGREVQREVEVRGPTGSGEAETAAPGSLRLQEHAHPVRFRNVWVEPLS